MHIMTHTHIDVHYIHIYIHTYALHVCALSFSCNKAHAVCMDHSPRHRSLHANCRRATPRCAVMLTAYIPRGIAHTRTHSFSHNTVLFPARLAAAHLLLTLPTCSHSTTWDTVSPAPPLPPSPSLPSFHFAAYLPDTATCASPSPSRVATCSEYFKRICT
jgi:hypothetical protein